MFYHFPKIENISDVLPAIENSPEFIVADRNEIIIINYMVSMINTFPPVTDYNSAVRRECRGIVFDKATGRILRRPFHKFWNVNEREETQLNNLDFLLPHKVYTKLDGSMISPFELGYKSEIIRFGTKMGITDVSKKAEEYINKNTNYIEFSKYCISNDITPIFEYTSPDNRIVVEYKKDNLTLLAARHMITGEYINLGDL